MTTRTWHKGPPPHVGWWLANTGRYQGLWRWWNGSFWSHPANDTMTAEEAVIEAKLGRQFTGDEFVQWTDYWPENARVPRIDPCVAVKPAVYAELLEVLTYFMPFIESEADDERQGPWVEKARAVLAKAARSTP